MTKHKVTLDFTTRPDRIHLSGAQIAQHELPEDVQEVWNIRRNEKSKVCAAAIVEDNSIDTVDECSITPTSSAESPQHTKCWPSRCRQNTIQVAL